MGRRSLAEEYYEDAEDWPSESDLDLIILYDFKSLKPNTRFWDNLDRLSHKSGGTRLFQRSILITRSPRVASAARRLALHYGASAAVFRGELVD